MVRHLTRSDAFKDFIQRQAGLVLGLAKALLQLALQLGAVTLGLFQIIFRWHPELFLQTAFDFAPVTFDTVAVHWIVSLSWCGKPTRKAVLGSSVSPAPDRGQCHGADDASQRPRHAISTEIANAVSTPPT